MQDYELNLKEIGDDVYSYYKDCYSSIPITNPLRGLLEKFDTRILFNFHLSIEANIDKYDTNQIESHIYALKLSDVWFTYETLIPLMEKTGYLTPRPVKKSKEKKARSISEALIAPKNVYDENEPYGKAGLFNFANIKDCYCEVLLERLIDEYICGITSISTSREDRKYISDYFLYLEDNSVGSQTSYLLKAYNQILHSPSVTPEVVLSVSYAIRNQYVHAGEIINSGIENVILKKTPISHSPLFCIKLFLDYCIRNDTIITLG